METPNSKPDANHPSVITLMVMHIFLTISPPTTCILNDYLPSHHTHPK